MRHEYREYRMLDIDWLKATFRYDETTGLLYNRHDRFMGVKADVQNHNWENEGSVAGKIAKNGYRVVMIGWKYYHQHIIIWMLSHDGKLPEYQLNHKNRDKADNRLDNLIDSPHLIQLKQRGKPILKTWGKSKFRGVRWDKQTQKWRVQIRTDGKNKYIGRFKDEIDAAHAYDDAARNAGMDEYLMNFPTSGTMSREDTGLETVQKNKLHRGIIND